MGIMLIWKRGDRKPGRTEKSQKTRCPACSVPLELHVLLDTSWFDSRVSHGDSIFSVFCGGLAAFSLLLRYLGYSAGVAFLLKSHDFLDPERLLFVFVFFYFVLF